MSERTHCPSGNCRSGHIWEARFHSQALCSDPALLTAMAYVDLNPIRAGIAKTPETSEYTGIRARIKGRYKQRTLAGAVARLRERGELNHFAAPIRALLPFSRPRAASDDRSSLSTWLPMRQNDYLELVDATGRIVRGDKRSHIDPILAPILERLGLSSDQWTQASTSFRTLYRRGKLRLLKKA